MRRLSTSVGLPRVQTVDGDFASFVTPSHGTTLSAPWSFNYAGPTIISFWSVDGFQFDLNTSSIPSGGQGFDAAGGFVSVNGTGTVSGHGFDPTAGTFNFSAQDPSAEGLFSFSAATGAVPEPGTILMVLSGASLLGAFLFICRRRA